nr:immunoglobulin heavy chain junction region [Mus musculus]
CARGWVGVFAYW